MTVPRRGEIWWASLQAPRGSQPGHRRPVLIVQSNTFNESRIETVVVAAITSNLRLADAPGNLRLRPSDSGLSRPSVVNVSQLLTIGRPFLCSKVARLGASKMNQVSEGIRLVLAL